jgi:glycine/D-amino acid oxidase-like deaminating enzyme
MSAQRPDDLDASLWHATARETVESYPLNGDKATDVAVIGGGFLGLTLALELAERGIRVTLLEASAIGHGASGRNGGLVVPSLPRVGPDDLIQRLGEPGERLVAAISGGAGRIFQRIARNGIRCDAVQAGWLNPAHGPGKLDGLAARAAVWARHGAAVEMLDAAEAQARIGSTAFHGALLDRTGGHLNPLAYARGLARAAQAAGAVVHSGTRVVKAVRRGPNWRLTTPTGHLIAARVIQATNAQVPGVPAGRDPTRKATVPLTVYQMATNRLAPGVRDRVLPGDESLSDTRNNLFAIRWTADDRIVVGGMAAVTQIGGAHRVPRAALARLAGLFPPLAGARMDYVWRGQASLTGDFLPRLFELGPDWLAPIACNGRGIVLTGLVAEGLAAYLAGGDAADLPLPLSQPNAIPARWAASRLPQWLLPLGMIADKRAERG